MGTSFRIHGLLRLVAPLAAVALLAPATPAIKTEKQPRFNGSFWLEDPAVGRMDASVKFTCELFNVGESEVNVDRFWLANPANTDDPYAVFDGATLAQGERLRLVREITVPLREYRRWEKGRAATLFLEIRGWGGGLPRLPFRVELERRRPPEE